jgi:putative flavoprotein involved in K+ transport
MWRTHTLIVGAGQAGLALSHCLSARGIDHVVLERGRIGERWAGRWDSLRLLTPNWMTRLPGWRYTGPDPDGYMTRAEVIGMLDAYARSFAAPVREQVTVLRAEPAPGGWRVTTDQGVWEAINLVVATGHCQHTRIPSLEGRVPSDVVQMTASSYRTPDQLPDGGVLVVGASASGVQLASELARSGRSVVLAVARHTRLPRQYRGRDILYWLDRIGSLARPLSSLPDPEAGRHEPSMQLVGSHPPQTVDLASLAQAGVRLAGRLAGFDGHRARFAGEFARDVGEADAQLTRLLAKIDGHIRAHGAPAASPAESLPASPQVPDIDEALDLRGAGVRTVLWATGFGRSYPWLPASVVDHTGEIRQVRGRAPAPGLYVIGLQFMIRRNSSFIDGVGDDAREIAAEIAQRAAQRRMEAA